MNCPNCKYDFNPNDRSEFGETEHDPVEVKTECTHCSKGFYTFINADDWTEDAAKEGDAS